LAIAHIARAGCAVGKVASAQTAGDGTHDTTVRKVVAGGTPDDGAFDAAFGFSLPSSDDEQRCSDHCGSDLHGYLRSFTEV